MRSEDVVDIASKITCMESCVDLGALAAVAARFPVGSPKTMGVKEARYLIPRGPESAR